MTMKNAVAGWCRSNDDQLSKVDWPTSFAAVPRRGDRVMSIDGKSTATIASVTHSVSNTHRPRGSSAREPYIIIELTRG